MLAVANYIMKGPFQANLSVVLLTALSILMSPFGLLAGAAIALITLRVSPVEGVKNLVIALITLFGLNMVVGSGVNLALIAAFEFFLPVFVLGLLLRRTNSLALTLEGAALMVVAALMIFYLSVDSPSAWWMGIFDQYLSPLLSQADVTYDATAMLSLAEMMTMLLSVFLLSLWFSIILIARWWQGALYYPGRFQQDFHQLSLSNNAVWIAIISCLAALFIGSGLIYDIAALMIAVFMFQGLAIAHNSVTQKQASNGWLVGIYLLLFLLPQTMLVLATLGLLDRWIKVRNRWS